MPSAERLNAVARKVATWIEEESLDLFLGSGLSIQAGYEGWDDLVTPLLHEIDITDVSLDPIVAAQFFVNECSGTRIRLEEHVR